MWIGGAVGQNQLKAQIPVGRFPSGLCREPFSPCEILRLADREIDLDRINGGYGSHRPAAWIDQVAYLELSLSGDAVDGRDESREIQVNLGRLNGRLSRLDLSFGRCHRSLGRQVILNGVVQILLAGSLLFCQWGVAVDVKFGSALNRLGIGELGSRLCQLSLRLVERRLKGARIDLKEQLPLLDECAF